MANLDQSQLAQIREAQVKAATAGFAQSLINNGYSEEQAAAASRVYSSTGGVLHKRASNIAAVRNGILTKVASLHR